MAPELDFKTEMLQLRILALWLLPDTAETSSGLPDFMVSKGFGLHGFTCQVSMANAWDRPKHIPH